MTKTIPSKISSGKNLKLRVNKNDPLFVFCRAERGIRDMESIEKIYAIKN